jgi:large subunit ribosomal protein L10
VIKLPSNKVLEAKKAIVEELAGKLKSACAGVLVSYKGITVAQDTALRKELREASIEYLVVKNTLLKRASEMVEMDEISSVLEGTTAIAISKGDHIGAAKILCKFADNNDFYKIKTGFVEGRVISEEEVRDLSKLPSKEVLIAQVLSGFNAPITGFVTVLGGIMKSLVIALNAIAEKKSA